jgi:hypothetical protein
MVCAKIPQPNDLCEVLHWCELKQTYELSNYDQAKAQHTLKRSDLKILIKNLTNRHKFMSFSSYRKLRGKKNIRKFCLNFFRYFQCLCAFVIHRSDGIRAVVDIEIGREADKEEILNVQSLIRDCRVSHLPDHHHIETKRISEIFEKQRNGL